jgi:hypothetical protein
MDKIKRLSKFARLYKIPMPAEEHSDYYFDLLRQCSAYSWLNGAIEQFVDLEKSIDSFREYEDKSLKTLDNRLKSSAAWNLFMSEKTPEKGCHKVNNEKNCRDYVIEFDAKQANYSIIRSFDKNSLPETWEEFAQDIHPAIRNSKLFRQQFFGNTNPGRIQKFQMAETAKIKEALQNHEIVHCTPDAVSIASKEKNLDIQLPETKLTYRARTYSFEQTPYGYVKTTHNKESQTQDLYGVPGNMFYLALKETVLKQEVNEKDLIFEIDGKRAYWAYDKTLPKSNSPSLHQEPQVL